MFDHMRSLANTAATLAALSDRDLAGVDGAALGDAVVQLDDAIRRLEAFRLAVTRAHARSRAWQRDGARSPAQWHRDRRRISGSRAAREVETAHRLEQLPRTAAALAAGQVSVSQAAAAAKAVAGLSSDAVAELDALVADTGPDATDRQLRDAVTDFAHRAAPDTLADRERQAVQRRHLSLGRAADGGWWIEGRLDVLGGEQVATALSALSRPRGEDDDRTAAQRRADALADLAERALRNGELPVEGGRRPQVAVTADLETLEQRAGASAGRLDHAGPVSSATVRQLACDAGVHRVITGGASQVLDVGREQRTVSVAQRRALVARDRGCVGCQAPPGWTDAHHVTFWNDGGRTDLENLVLLCRSCHTGVHVRGWRVVIDPETGRRRVRRPRRTTPPRIGREPPDHDMSAGAPRTRAATRTRTGQPDATSPGSRTLTLA